MVFVCQLRIEIDHKDSFNGMIYVKEHNAMIFFLIFQNTASGFAACISYQFSLNKNLLRQRKYVGGSRTNS